MYMCMASFPFLGDPALISVKCLRFQSLYILSLLEICTDLGILVVNAKYAQKYTVAYTRFFAQCIVHVTFLPHLLVP